MAEQRRTSSFEQRLAMEALRLKEQARHLKPGKRREAMLRKARQADIDALVNQWIASPGLQPPET